MAFSRGATGLSHVSTCVELIFGVTVESVQGNQLYLEWIGTSGSFFVCLFLFLIFIFTIFYFKILY